MVEGKAVFGTLSNVWAAGCSCIHRCLSCFNVCGSVFVQAFCHFRLCIVERECWLDESVSVITCVRSAACFAQGVTVKRQVDGLTNIETRKILDVEVGVRNERIVVINATILESIVFEDGLQVLRLYAF